MLSNSGPWNPFGDVFGPWQGHLEAFWGLLGLCLRPLSAVLGAACRLLENSNESGMIWGWGGKGRAGLRSRLGSWMTYTRGLPMPKVIRATSQQVNIYIYIYIYLYIVLFHWFLSLLVGIGRGFRAV